MFFYFEIVQCIEHKIEFFKLIDVESSVFNVDVMCFKLKIEIEFCSELFYNLIIFLLFSLLLLYIFKAMILINALDFPDMLIFEHKLLIQIPKVNGIKAGHINFVKAGENRILE